MPPPFTLDPHSESDEGEDSLLRNHCHSGTFQRQMSGDEGGRHSAQESPPPGTPAMHPQHTPTPKPKHTTGQSYRGGTKLRQRTSAALAALHREEGDKSTEEGAIFARAGMRGSDWSPELEQAFRRQINTQLISYLRKHFPEAAERAAKAREQRTERAAEHERERAATGPCASPPSKVMPSKQEDICLANALPKVMPEEGPWMQGDKKPQAARTESAPSPSTGSGGYPASTPAAPPTQSAPASSQPAPAAAAAAEPPKRRYIPPQLRKRMEREAQEAQEAAEAAAAAA